MQILQILHDWWPLICAMILLAIFGYFVQREDREDKYGQTAIDYYFKELTNKTWQVTMQALHLERNQVSVGSVKKAPYSDKVKQAYMYSYDYLKNNSLQNLGLYGAQPDYLYLWLDSHQDLKDKSLKKQLLAFNEWLDQDVPIYYVFYNQEKQIYEWLDIVQAAADKDIPMKQIVREKVMAGELLATHFTLNSNYDLEWQDESHNIKQGLLSSGKNNFIKFAVVTNRGITSIQGVQFYKIKEDADLVQDGRDLVNLEQMYQMILKHLQKEVIKISK